MTLTPAARRWAIVAACLGAACGGGGSSQRPSTPPPPVVTIQTDAGVLRVVAEGCEPDLDAMRREVNGVVKRSGLTASLDGWTLYARTPAASRKRCEASHGDACTDEQARTMHVWCPTAEHRAGGTEHETGHALAYAAGLGCWRRIGHDRDFRCRRTR